MDATNRIVKIRNTIQGMLTPALEATHPEYYKELQAIKEALLDIYVDLSGHNEDIVAPGGYHIPSLRTTPKPQPRTPPECCGG